jgi:FemAB-related protein (PEP-CTERM system-associated)
MKLNGWSELVEHSDDCTVYHLRQWGTLLEEVHGHKLVYLQKDKGIFPLAYVRSMIFSNRLISLPFADYGGLYAQDEETAEELISECQERAQRLGVDFIEIRCPNARYFEMLTQYGFVKRDDYSTFVLQLDRNVEELWKSIGEKKKKKVRKAGRVGIHTIEATDKADLKTFYMLYQKTMKRLGSPPQPYRFFERMWDLLYPRNMTMFLVRYEGDYIAGKLVFLHNKTIYQAYNPSLSEYYNLAPNDLVQWDLIKWGNEHRFRQLNFGRSRKNEGPELFKQQWGGESVSMPYFYRFYNKELSERQEVRYRWISTLWSKYMPERVANRVGPLIIKQIG